MWKPGQLITIKHKTYQVIKDKNYWGSCILCAFVHCEVDTYPCTKCSVNSKDAKIPRKCFLRRIYKASDKRSIINKNNLSVSG